MPWPPRRPSSHELQLQRECEVLQLKLLKANSELRTKTVYAQRLEYLVHERSERVDELNAKLEQSRAKLDEECEHLADMIRIMPQLEAMLSPK
jgi:predicted  nucleic acid-binding Zn-ribbon protein